MPGLGSNEHLCRCVSADVITVLIPEDLLTEN
ncbi:hypothetical protein K239x_14620 [Planctomycetes bacterium K23_9]|uniref:Uncharacterized protein n=1 Tax=Stieleria marina TaxID=1930275 RepID=A0A517NQW2_9BACT|nr:hypothetical protein K239x_14620 [Planctomycetes bacterium K23_9]